MDIQLNRITSLVSNIRIGETGYAFLVDKEKRLIALPESGYGDFGITAETAPFGEIMDEAKLPNISPEFFELLRKISSGDNQVTTVNLGGGERFVAYHQIPEVQYNLAIIVPSKEMLAQVADVMGDIHQTLTGTFASSGKT